MSRLEALVPLDAPDLVLARTRTYLASTPSVVTALADSLWVHNDLFDALPIGGDCSLAYQEADTQLRASVSLAFLGFYSQALTSLRTVCEMDLLQAALPAAGFSTEVNVMWPLGVRSGLLEQGDTASLSVEEWAVLGGRIPRRKSLLDDLLRQPPVAAFAEATSLRPRIQAAFDELDRYVHVRGWLRTALRTHVLEDGFSDEALSFYATQVIRVCQLSTLMILMALSPRVAGDLASGVVDRSLLFKASSLLLPHDAAVLRELYGE